jgi:hypothetical protein
VSAKDRRCTGKGCEAPIYRDNRSGLCRNCLNASRATQPGHRTVAEDRSAILAKTAVDSLKAKYAEALKTIEGHEKAIEAAKVLAAGVDTFTIKPHEGSGTSEATAVILASDWHVEETVGPEVGSLNRYNLGIAERRATKFFQSALRLIRLLQQDVTINHVILALLWDFITNELHEAESAETNALKPNAAILFAKRLIISGLQFLLDHSKLTFVLPCHSGNHARTTKRTRFSSENDHSLEFLMYHDLASYFRHEPRLTFLIPEGYHSYVNVYGQTLRFHHGHAIKYAGGVGGIYIPVHKALAGWNRGQRADLDLFGHFHQQVDGGSFVCNGSLIGYNAFALSIKAALERPQQTLLLIDKKRGRTCTWKILVEDK